MYFFIIYGVQFVFILMLLDVQKSINFLPQDRRTVSRCTSQRAQRTTRLTLNSIRFTQYTGHVATAQTERNAVNLMCG